MMSFVNELSYKRCTLIFLLIISLDDDGSVNLKFDWSWVVATCCKTGFTLSIGLNKFVINREYSINPHR